MQLKLQSKSTLEIQGDNNIVYVEFRDGEFKGELGENLLVSSVERTGGISGPGEYEYNGVSLVAMETKEVNVGNLELALVQVDGMSVFCVLDNPGELAKEHYEFLEDVDVLVLDKNVHIDEVDKFVNRINPYVLVVLNTNKEEAEKYTGMTVELEDKKFKFTTKDFEAEEPATRLLILN